MNNKFTDEQLDLIAKNLINDYALNSESLDEIADSPVTWWKIKREINRQKPEEVKGWINVWYRQFIAFTAFAVLAVGFGIGFLWILNLPNNNDLVKVETPIIEQKQIVEPQIGIPNQAEKQSAIADKITSSTPRKLIAKTKIQPAEVNQTKTEALKVEPKLINAKVKSTPKQTPKAVEVKSTNTEEVKTEFISLSYMPTPESGQIVRVKVPRAMMVSLGVSNNVAKNTELVNAEVILGDDGSSRAIRFISTK